SLSARPQRSRRREARAMASLDEQNIAPRVDEVLARLRAARAGGFPPCPPTVLPSGGSGCGDGLYSGLPALPPVRTRRWLGRRPRAPTRLGGGLLSGLRL